MCCLDLKCKISYDCHRNSFMFLTATTLKELISLSYLIIQIQDGYSLSHFHASCMLLFTYIYIYTQYIYLIFCSSCLLCMTLSSIQNNRSMTQSSVMRYKRTQENANINMTPNSVLNLNSKWDSHSNVDLCIYVFGDK